MRIEQSQALRGIRTFRLSSEGVLRPFVDDDITFVSFQPVTAHCGVGVGLSPEMFSGAQAPDAPTAHAPGSQNCTCGLHGYWGARRIPEAQGPGADADLLGMGGWVMGILEGWGEVSTSQQGFRAEVGRVVALVGDPLPPWRLRTPSRPWLRGRWSESLRWRNEALAAVKERDPGLGHYPALLAAESSLSSVPLEN